MKLRFLMSIVAVIAVALASVGHLRQLWAKLLLPASLSLLWLLILWTVARGGGRTHEPNH
jgi:hypothetical protein